ncbi:MAG: hypothetical protein IPM57_02760 [Oligoflexia bacterium]|nr:hypothetical protein [Oligoflexia bacterium]
MKVFILALTTLISLNIFAADLSLQSGETAIIKSNTETRVSCSGGSGGSNQSGTGDCYINAEGFKAIMASCFKTYSGGTCVIQHWPKFKEVNPKCIYAGMATCLEYCQKTYSGGTCAQTCQ